MVLSVTWNGTSYSIPQSGERGWASLTTFLQALATSAQSTGKQLIGRRTATVSPVTVTATTDAYVGVNVSAAIAAVNLPAGVNGQIFIITDESDAANTYNITINPNGANTINSTTSFVMSRNSQSVMLLFSGSDWVVVANTSPSNSIISVTDSAQIDLTLSGAGALSGLIVAGSIANVDISNSAAISYSKLAALTSASILVGSAGNVATVTAVTGDVTISNAGVTAIASGVIVNGDVDASAAIARSKLASGTADHVIINDGAGVLSSSAQLASTKGGTGVSNAGTLTYGASNVTLTTSGATTLTVPTTGTVATLAGVEALTLKDYQGGTASNTSRITVPKDTTANLAALTRKQATIVYDTDLNKLKYDDGATLTAVGSGSGSGAINYISNADFEDGTVTSWTMYADASAATPVDGTGGSPASTFAINSSSPLRGTYDAVLTKSAADRRGEGVAYAFTLSAADVSKTLQLTFDSKASANLASGDVAIYVYDVTNSTLITPSSTAVPTGTSSQYSVAFQTTTSTSYRLIFHIATTNATAYTLEIDQISISPIVRPMVAGESDWLAFTPVASAGFGTVTNASAFYRRIGDSMEIMGSWTTGTSVGSIATLTMPSTLTINSSKISITNTTSNAGPIVGNYESHAANMAGNMVVATGTSTSLIYFASTYSTATPLIPANGNVIATSSVVFTFKCTIPITSWSSNITLASTTPMIEYVYNTSATDAADTTSFGYGAAGIAGVINTTVLTANRLKRVRFQNVIQPTDRIVLEYSTNRTIWYPLIDNDANLAISPLFFQNGVYYGIGINSVVINSTDVDVRFGQYSLANGATYGSAGQAWNGTGAGYWRVAKYSSIGGAELAPATSTSTGTITRENVWTAYTPTFSAGFGTVSSVSCFYKVLGDSLFVRGNGTAGTTTGAAGTITLPSGFTISSTKVAAVASLGGYLAAQDGAITGQLCPIAIQTGSSTTQVYLTSKVSGANLLANAGANASITTGNLFSFHFEVPIV